MRGRVALPLPRVGATGQALALLMLLLASPAAGEAQSPGLPNLVALPPYNLQVGAVDGGALDPLAPRALRFTAAVENRADVALDIVGVPTGPDHLVAHQCTAWQGALCVSADVLGEYPWHGYHMHWHMGDFFQYELAPVLADGSTGWPVAVVRRTFLCIRDSQPTNGTLLPFTNASPYTQCTDSREGISPWWRFRVIGDVAEQQIPLAGISDGRYVLVVIVNPDGTIRESQSTDNVGALRIELSGGGTQVQIVDAG